MFIIKIYHTDVKVNGTTEENLKDSLLNFSKILS